MREIIEHCGQTGGRFEMPHAVGLPADHHPGHSGWRTRHEAKPVMANLKSAIGVVVTGWLGPDVQERGVRPCAVTNR
jgi:hypothetical protein